jgi:4-carboxymuconolactone decarboxylase
MTDALVDRGNAIMEEMFGPEHGAARLEQATDFTRPFEELVRKYCFGEVWGRDEELPWRIRSMLTIAILVAQGREQEVRVHVKGAIANGVTKDEIREVLLHAAVYCGVPAAVNGYRNATQALEEIGLS